MEFIFEILFELIAQTVISFWLEFAIVLIPDSKKHAKVIKIICTVLFVALTLGVIITFFIGLFNFEYTYGKILLFVSLGTVVLQTLSGLLLYLYKQKSPKRYRKKEDHLI